MYIRVTLYWGYLIVLWLFHLVCIGRKRTMYIRVTLYWGYLIVLWLFHLVCIGRKRTMYIRVTLYWGHWIVLWLFHLVCILCCGCLNLFCNVWVVWQLCVCFGNMCTCIYCVLYCLDRVFVLFRLCIFILICFVCTSVRATDTEWQLNGSK